MTLPAPNLDDRRFQDLVDDAKRMVQQRCPEWTDHNVSDPGVTLIETFAFMVDQLLYRLNRVPELNYLKFLDLIGVRLFPPGPARAPVTFWLSAPQPATVRIPAGTEVATLRTEAIEAVAFETADDLEILPTAADLVASAIQPVAVPPAPGRPRQRPELLLLRPGPEARRRPPRRAVPGRAPVHRHPALRLPGGGRRRRPHQPAAHVGGVGRRRVGAVRGEPGRHRRPEPSRRRGRAPSRQPPDLGPRRPGRGLAALPGDPGPGEPARLQLVAPDPPPGRLHRRGHHRRGQRRGVHRRGPGRLRRRPRPAVPAPAPAGGALRRAAGARGGRRRGLGRVAAGRELRRQRARGSPFRPRRGPGPGRAGTGRAGGRRRSPPLRRRPAQGRAGTHPVVPQRRRAPGQRRPGRHQRAQVVDPVRGVGREPAGGRWAASTASRWRAPRCGRRSCSGRGGGRSRPRTTSSWPGRRRRRWPGSVARSTGEGTRDAAVRVLVVPAAPEGDLGQLRIEDLVPDDRTLARVAAYLDERRVIGTRVVVEPPHYLGVTVVARLVGRERVSVQTAPRRRAGRPLRLLFTDTRWS